MVESCSSSANVSSSRSSCCRAQGTASTLTRTEVRGGGKKPYAQKGTGNARRGSRVSPLFPGGGIIFGPKVWALAARIARHSTA